MSEDYICPECQESFAANPDLECEDLYYCNDCERYYYIKIVIPKIIVEIIKPTVRLIFKEEVKQMAEVNMKAKAEADYLTAKIRAENKLIELRKVHEKNKYLGKDETTRVGYPPDEPNPIKLDDSKWSSRYNGRD